MHALHWIIYHSVTHSFSPPAPTAPALARVGRSSCGSICGRPFRPGNSLGAGLPLRPKLVDLSASTERNARSVLCIHVHPCVRIFHSHLAFSQSLSSPFTPSAPIIRFLLHLDCLVCQWPWLLHAVQYIIRQLYAVCIISIFLYYE